MRTLVTGGAGFIGSHLVDGLLSGGDQVIVLDDLSTGSRANLSRQGDNSRLEFIEADVRDAAAVGAAVRRCDRVFHLAAMVGVRRVVEQPVTTLQVNEAGTMNVLAAAAERGVRTVIASSSEVYGRNEDMPLKEDSPTILGPTTVSRWSYSVSKLAAEHLALGYGKHGLPISIVRYFNVYGPRYDASGYGGVIARFIEQAITNRALTLYGDGNQTRSFLYVAEAAAATIAAADTPSAVGQVFNIGHPAQTTIDHLAALIIDLCGSRSAVERLPLTAAYGKDFEETTHRRPDTSKAAGLLRFQAEIDLETGLRQTIEWRERAATAA